MTSKVFSPIPQVIPPENEAAVNGLRNAYIQKYVPNAATSDQAATNEWDVSVLDSAGFVSVELKGFLSIPSPITPWGEVPKGRLKDSTG